MFVESLSRLFSFIFYSIIYVYIYIYIHIISLALHELKDTIWLVDGLILRVPSHLTIYRWYSISQEICTRFLLCCALLWLYILIFPYPSGLLHWHCGNLTIAPVPAKQPWWIWINTSCEFIMNDCITTTKQSTTKPCAYFLGYTVIRTLEP